MLIAIKNFLDSTGIAKMFSADAETPICVVVRAYPGATIWCPKKPLNASGYKHISKMASTSAG